MRRKRFKSRIPGAAVLAVSLLARSGTAIAQTPASGAPPDADASPAPSSPADARIEALEARVRELESRAAHESSAPPSAAPTAGTPEQHSAPLDVREPPFSAHDWSWLNGSNYQPASLLRIGPVTPTLLVDTFYAWDFWQPIDHTIFPSTTAPRHNEIGVNLAYVGLDLNGIDTPLGGPIGRFEIQYGANTETDAGQDTTTTRGFYLTNRAFNFVKQAAAGWHFHWMHGVNAEIGILPSYLGFESYVPQENWSYAHSFLPDFTPYYLSGVRTQWYFTENTKLEVWLVNGWQTFGEWHETHGGGYLLNWRPTGRVYLSHATYVGQDQPRTVDPNNQSIRFLTDNVAQFLAVDALGRSFFQRLAFCIVFDAGYEYRGPNAGIPVMGAPTPPNGLLMGAALAVRAEWTRTVMSTVRADVFYDQSGAVISQLPVGNLYSLPGNGHATNPFEFLAGGIAATLDWRPSPWLVARLEYAHRLANQPYFGGPGGITGPNGLPPASPADAAAFHPDLRQYDDRVIFNLTLRL